MSTVSPPSLDEVGTVIDPTPYWQRLDDRFGIPPSTFDGFVLIHPHTKKLYLVSEDHRPPGRPDPQTIGLPFMRVQMKNPKLTTAAARQFGTEATKNVVQADKALARAYLSRENTAVTLPQIEHCTGRGYVLVRYHEIVLGVGFLQAAESGASLRSMLPKAWARPTDALRLPSAPPSSSGKTDRKSA